MTDNLRLITFGFFGFACLAFWVGAVTYNIKMRILLKRRVALEFGNKSQMAILLEYNFNYLKFWRTMLSTTENDSNEIRIAKSGTIRTLKIQFYCFIGFIISACLAVLLTMR